MMEHAGRSQVIVTVEIAVKHGVAINIMHIMKVNSQTCDMQIIEFRKIIFNSFTPKKWITKLIDKLTAKFSSKREILCMLIIYSVSGTKGHLELHTSSVD